MGIPWAWFRFIYHHVGFTNTKCGMRIPFWRLKKNVIKSCRLPLMCFENQTGLRAMSSKSDTTSMIRNVGIIAHVDAGKTTTSERILYYSGFSSHLGDVDSGDTVMDFLEQERERGITVNSAVVTFNWNRHKINLIDTPGHVDFTMEVERVLQVLDGAVIILDSSAGVEAQTLTVWHQADKYRVPCIAYLNKMDKKSADVKSCLHSMQDKFGVSPLLIHMPVSLESSFSGIVDLINFELVLWNEINCSDGAIFTRQPLSVDNVELYEKALAARTILISGLAENDDYIADYVLSDSSLDKLSPHELRSALRRSTMARKVIPVVCGSSLRNKGVQTLMDAVVSFLPSPDDIPREFASYYGTDLCALAFKVSHHKQRGPLTFLRLYSGLIENGNFIFNVTQHCSERITRVLQVQADEYVDIYQATAGNIVAVAGLKQTITGDTITTSQAVAKTARKVFDTENKTVEGNHLKVFPGFNVPTPVFFCSIEPFSVAYQKRLDQALGCLQKEDPSFKVDVCAETGQIILFGMGELHLRIIQSRIDKEFGIKTELGSMQVAYRESVSESVQINEILEKKIGDEHHCVHISMSVSPDSKEHFKEMLIDPSNELAIPHFLPHHKKALENGVMAALSSGPLLGFPVISVSVALHEFHIQRGTSLAMASACAMQCISKGLIKAKPHLLEPMMKVEINIEEKQLHSVLADLARRRSHIINIIYKNDLCIVEAITPLAELKGYSTDLRIITSGTASFSLHLSHYNKMNTEQQQKIIKGTA